MMNFAELYCAHIEQLGIRYPDAYYIRYGRAIDTDQIESKIILAGEGKTVFISFLAPDGTIRHLAQPKERPAQKKARANGLRTN